MSQKEAGPEIPSTQDLAAFAREYYRSYMEAVAEKKPETLPLFAQEAPYMVRCYLLPNGCISMMFTSAKELQAEGAEKDWEEVQGAVVKGVDHFAGFYPFEGRSLGDWNKRGRRDALRDIRLQEKSQLIRAGAELEGIIDNISRMVKANPWLGKSGTEMITTLRSLDAKVKGGFPTVDAIASLQSLKAYVPGTESVTIEFPEKELLEDISEGIKNLANMESKLEMFENRMFEIEKLSSASATSPKVADIEDRVGRLEKQLEKVSNILTMLNSKVENYFSKGAEKERQSDLEKRIDDHASKTLAHEAKIAEMEKEAERLVEELRKMTASINKDIHDSRKRIARMEKHFVDFAKMVQE